MFKYKVPVGIKLLTWATAIRWVGWGFFEAMLPVFIFSFSGSFAETGFLKSIYDLVFLISAPFIGVLADKISSKTIILIGLAVYPLIGLSYFFAGVSGLALFIVIARALNGAAYALDSVGRNTYFRLHAPKDEIGAVYGYFDVIATGAWVLAVLASIYLIKFFAINELALAIIPTVIIAILIVSFLKDGGHEKLKDGFRHVFSDGIFKSLWSEIKSWNAGVRLIALINFSGGFVSVIGSYLIPIRVYQEGGSLPKVIIIGAILALPAVFDFRLGRFADKHRQRSLFFGLAGLVVLFLALALSESFLAQMIIAFLLSLFMNLIGLSTSGLITRMVTPDHFGRMSGLNSDISTVGTILGPIAIGFAVDQFGFSATVAVLSFLTLLFLIMLFAKRRHLSI